MEKKLNKNIEKPNKHKSPKTKINGQHIHKSHKKTSNLPSVSG